MQIRDACRTHRAAVDQQVVDRSIECSVTGPVWIDPNNDLCEHDIGSYTNRSCHGGTIDIKSHVASGIDCTCYVQPCAVDDAIGQCGAMSINAAFSIGEGEVVGRSEPSDVNVANAAAVGLAQVDDLFPTSA